MNNLRMQSLSIFIHDFITTIKKTGKSELFPPQTSRFLIVP